MNEALIKLMKPELDAAKIEGKAEGKTEGVTELAEVTKRLKKVIQMRFFLIKDLIRI